MNRGVAGAEANEPKVYTQPLDTTLAIEICAAVEAVVATVVSEYIAQRPIPGPPNQQAEVCSRLWPIGQNRRRRDIERIGLEIIGMIGLYGQCSFREELAKKVSEFDQELSAQVARARIQMLRISPLYAKAKQSWHECDEAALALRVALVNTLLINEDTTSLVELGEEAQRCNIIPPDICNRLIAIENHKRRAGHRRAPPQPISNLLNDVKKVDEYLSATLQRWLAYDDVTKEKETVGRIFNEYEQRIQRLHEINRQTAAFFDQVRPNQDDVVERGEQNPHLTAMVYSTSIPQGNPRLLSDSAQVTDLPSDDEQWWIVQDTSMEGDTYYQAQSNVDTQKVELNADATLEGELAKVQNSALKLLTNCRHDLDELKLILRNFLRHGTVPESNNEFWSEERQTFVDALRNACEIQLMGGSTRDKIRKLLERLSELIEMELSCVKVSMKFSAELKLWKFFEYLLKENLSQEIANSVFDDKFRSLLTTPITADIEIDQEKEKMLRDFMEWVAKQIHIRIAFRLHQDLAPKNGENSSGFQFTFTVSSPKISSYRLPPDGRLLFLDEKKKEDENEVTLYLQVKKIVRHICFPNQWTSVGWQRPPPSPDRT